MLSVNSEAASNVAFQGAPHRSPWSNQPPPNDLFGALVNQNKVADTPPPPQPAPLPRHSDQTPAPAEAGSSGSSASNPPPANDPNNNADAGPPQANANADNANASAGGSPGNDANQPSATQSTDGKDTTTKSADSTKSGDANTVDPVASQQPLPTTPIPLAVAVPANPVPTNVPAATPTSGGTTPPLAIAAAAIAATSQALSGQGGTPAQGKANSSAGPSGPTTTSTTTLSGTPTAKTTASATANPTVVPPVTAPVTSPNAASANAATQASAAAAAVSVTPKTASDKASASTPATDDTGSSATSGPILQNGQPQQGAAAARPETANLAVQAATSDAASTPSVSAHEHSPAANAGNALAGPPDPGAQALGTLPPQPGSGATTAPGAALSVTPAANGPVPLNGLALEIAASVKSGKSRFEISLDPAELGRIDVRIDIDRNGQVTSHLTVEKPETLSMLRQDAPQLQRALDDAGLKTGNGGLQFSLRDQSTSGQNSGNDPGANSQRLVIADEDTVPAAVAGRTYGRTLGPSGGVDIRV